MYFNFRTVCCLAHTVKNLLCLQDKLLPAVIQYFYIHCLLHIALQNMIKKEVKKCLEMN